MTAPRTVVLLTQDDCGFCDQAKDILRRVGADVSLAVEEV